MMLGEIRHYLKKRDVATLSDVATRFDVSPEAAQLAVEYWMKQGKVKAVSAACGSSCGGCGSANESYQWVDKMTPVTWYKS
ncbi:MAG: FeoC-like transcriptional regulator [Thiotrichaceae bacterium]|jgi:predicted ArsR family transcriptional regulator